MTFVNVTSTEGLAILRLGRGKVNALNEPFVDELTSAVGELGEDPAVRAVVITGEGKFFSFGFDIPELYDYSKEDFTRYLEKFTGLYTLLYELPKPVVAALNGHAVAGGCMLALACDRRLMVPDHAKISLNEITFGASVFAGSVEMLVACTGQREAEEILTTGAMYTGSEAIAMGLVDETVEPARLMEAASAEARELARNPEAFRSLKSLLRSPIAARMRDREAASIREFVRIWYSEETRRQLEKITIRR